MIEERVGVIVYGGLIWYIVFMLFGLGFVVLFIIGGLIGVVFVNVLMDVVMYDIINFVKNGVVFIFEFYFLLCINLFNNKLDVLYLGFFIVGLIDGDGFI